MFVPFLIAVIHHCYAAYQGNDAGRNTARIVMLAFELAIALSIVPSGASFAETILYWLKWWNIPFLAPFALFLAGGILLAKPATRWRFLLGMSCFAVGNGAQGYVLYSTLLYAYSIRAAVILGVVFSFLLAVLYVRLKCPRGVTGAILIFCGLCVSARCVFDALEILRWIPFYSNGNSIAQLVLAVIANGECFIFVGTTLLLAAGFLRARSVLLGVSSPKSECATALYFGLSQFLVIFCFSVMAAASV